MNEKQYQSLCGWAARTPARQKCLTACFRLLRCCRFFVRHWLGLCAVFPCAKQVGLWIALPFGHPRCPGFCWSP